MDTSNSLVQDPQAKKWLKQFALGDRPLAARLLDAFLLVSRDDFFQHLRTLILTEAEKVPGPIALYAERELRHRYGIPHRLFAEPRRLPRRAIGKAGPALVQPTKAYDPSVGSEGIVAQMISELSRQYPKKFLLQPGPDQIRKKRPRAFWIVTDLIGSGERAHRYLQAAWKVRSLRSWWSGHLLRFGVIAYAATVRGEQYVASHPSKPEILIVQPCPTIRSSFVPKVAATLEALCSTYDPTIDPSSSTLGWLNSSLGHCSTGALIAFAHGAPNNVPLMFHKASQIKSPPWIPLFPSRVTAGLDKNAFGVSLPPEKIKTQLEKIGQSTLARSSAILNSDITTREVFVLLGALSRPPRMNDRIIASRTGLPTHVIFSLISQMTSYGWIDSQRRLTDQGAGQLAHAKKQLRLTTAAMTNSVGKSEPEHYYPTSLRQPI